MSDAAELDATGLVCPLPILRANRAMRALAPGGVLTVRATDPAAKQDFPAYCAQTGHALIETAEEAGGVLLFRIRKKA
jgi:tRNA 2-thiouridine synthesizing protein A